jgi:hypothetical protein
MGKPEERRTKMGQYFVLANHTREEYVNPHTVGDMYKQVEIVLGTGNLNKLALFLMTDGRVDGGAIRGRWGGDYVTLVGDYRHSAKPPELPKPSYPSWDKIHETYRDVGREVVEEFNAWVTAEGCPEEAIPYYPSHGASERDTLGRDEAYYPVGETTWGVYDGPTMKEVRGPRPKKARYAFVHAVHPNPPGTPLPKPERLRTKVGAQMHPDMVVTLGR